MLVGIVTVALGVFGTPHAAGALIIQADFGAGMSASSKTVVNQAIAFYQNAFTDNVTVRIAFDNMATGLGSSSTSIHNPGFAAYSAALVADRKSADDFVANYAPGALNPITGTADFFGKSAALRSVGINQAAATDCGAGHAGLYDGCIGVRLNITNDVDAGGAPGYSLISVLEHEINEVMGTVSGAGRGTGPRAPDLFRMSGTGVGVYGYAGAAGQACNAFSSTSVSSDWTNKAYFSIDGGVTLLNEYNNCNNGSDYGDWVTHTPTQVQDAVTNNSGAPVMTLASTETRLLDVIGWDRAQATAVPEPGTLSLMITGLGAIGVVARRRRWRSK